MAKPQQLVGALEGGLTTVPEGLQVRFPALPRFGLVTEAEAHALAREHHAWARGPDGKALEAHTRQIETAAADALTSLGHWGTEGARILLQDYARIRVLADPIYSWVPKAVSKNWVRRKGEEGNRVARLYYFLVGCAFGSTPAKAFAVIEGAALANGLCRATYAAVRERLSRLSRGVGFALLRMLIDDDQRLCNLLRSLALGGREAFPSEFRSDPVEVLGGAVAGYARATYRGRGGAPTRGKHIVDPEERAAEAALALTRAVGREAAMLSHGDDTSLLLEALGALPGRVMAQAGGLFSNAARKYMRGHAMGPTDWPPGCDVLDDQPQIVDLLPDNIGNPEEEVARREAMAGLTAAERDLLGRLLLSDPGMPPEQRWQDLGISRSEYYRRRADLKKKLVGR